MKKLLVLMLSAGLVLGACGNSESKSEDKKQDTKSDSEKKKEKKQKEDKQKQEQKAKDEKAKKEKQAKDEQRKKDEELAQQNSQQEAAQNEQQATQEQQTQQSTEPSVQQPVQENVQQEPTDQEKMEANAKVAKEHGYTGIPNGDVGLLDPSTEGYYSNDQLDPKTGLPKDNAVPHSMNDGYSDDELKAMEGQDLEDDEPLEWVEDEDGNPTLKGGL